MTHKPRRAVDSSVIIAAFASWHESHGPALQALSTRPALVAHCALEAYSVLTRLPAPHRVDSTLVAAMLEDAFKDVPIVLDAKTLASLPRELQKRGVARGSAYDGLIAMTAAAHGATLVTLDVRAEATYRKCGVAYELLA